MNKTQFLKQLRYRLEGRLPENELADVLSYYEAYLMTRRRTRKP